MNEITADINNAECVTNQTHLGYYTYINICSGKHVDVSWAFGDWATFDFLLTVFIIFILAVIYIIHEVTSY